MSRAPRRPAPLSAQPQLLDRIRSATVTNHPGQPVHIKDPWGNHAVVQWIEFIQEYSDCGWDLA